jgi:hypothetical protein
MIIIAVSVISAAKFNAVAEVIRYDGFWLLDREEVCARLSVSRVAQRTDATN